MKVMNNDFNRLSLDPEKRRQAELLKDLMMQRKRSLWPLVLGVIAILAILGAGGTWYYMPPEKRPSLDILLDRIVSLSKKLLNASIVSAPTSVPASSQIAGVQSSTASAHSDDAGLLSK